LKVLKTKVDHISDSLGLEDQSASRLIQETIEKLMKEIMLYFEITSGKIEFDPQQLLIIQDIPELLVRARIALNWSHRDLAERAGIHETQVSKYERTQYRGISLSRLQHITNVLLVALAQNS
jgi:ribosome-binding protein aMBF1 (putative translation factor)